MKYVSTRGLAPRLNFCDAILTGLARDGGLYVPETWPQVSKSDIAGFANKPYADVAFDIISRFVGDDIEPKILRAMIDEAYATFNHRSVTPITELAPGQFILELFHGPTLAFKDVAMQFLGRAMDHVLGSTNARATIVGATSGDTGSAAIEAFRGRDNTEIFILHPEGKTSLVQRRQMTTVLDANVHNIAIKGTFDDCQDIVKGMFNNHHFRDKVKLSGVNSINWGRIVAQVVYYFTAAAALGSPHRKVSFCVPTGNFGDIFAGFVAHQMGLPIDQLVIATNKNDILRRTFEQGAYEVTGVSPTSSPSMDIQVSSNFERLLFDAYERDGTEVKTLMDRLKQAGRFDIADKPMAYLRDLMVAGTASEQEVAATIAGAHSKSGYLMDPHTAVASAVAAKFAVPSVPMIVLSTAHPAKFQDAVESATGIKPALPEALSDLLEREERYDILPNDQQAVEDYIAARSRA